MDRGRAGGLVGWLWWQMRNAKGFTNGSLRIHEDGEVEIGGVGAVVVVRSNRDIDGVTGRELPEAAVEVGCLIGAVRDLVNQSVIHIDEHFRAVAVVVALVDDGIGNDVVACDANGVCRNRAAIVGDGAFSAPPALSLSDV